jgi:hypothetical protein
MRKTVVISIAVLLSAISMVAAKEALAGPVTKPSMPATLTIPGTPIVPGSAGVDLGYLRGSDRVSTAAVRR